LVQFSLAEGSGFDDGVEVATPTSLHQDRVENTKYYYRVSAISGGRSSAAATAAATTFPAKPDLAATPLSAVSMKVTWPVVDGLTYDLAFSADGTAPLDKYTPLIPTTPGVYIHEKLLSGKAYYYSLVAKNAAGKSEAGLTHSGTLPGPSEPTGFRVVSKTQTEIFLKWNGETNAKYTLKFGTTANDYTDDTKIDQTATDFPHSGRTANTTYFYQLTTELNGAVIEDRLEVETLPDPPAPPADVVASADYNTKKVTVSWSSSHGEFEIERRNASAGSNWGVPYKVTAKSWVDVMWEESQTLEYRVRAVYKGVYSDYASSPPIKIYAPPPVPEIVKAVPLDASRLEVTWDSNKLAEADILVEVSTSRTTGFETRAKTAKGSDGNYTVDNLAADTQYFLRLKSKNPAGESKPSDPPAEARTKTGNNGGSFSDLGAKFYDVSPFTGKNSDTELTTTNDGEMVTNDPEIFVTWQPDVANIVEIKTVKSCEDKFAKANILRDADPEPIPSLPGHARILLPVLHIDQPSVGVAFRWGNDPNMLNEDCQEIRIDYNWNNVATYDCDGRVCRIDFEGRPSETLIFIPPLDKTDYQFILDSDPFSAHPDLRNLFIVAPKATIQFQVPIGTGSLRARTIVVRADTVEFSGQQPELSVKGGGYASDGEKCTKSGLIALPDNDQADFGSRTGGPHGGLGGREYSSKYDGSTASENSEQSSNIEVKENATNAYGNSFYPTSLGASGACSAEVLERPGGRGGGRILLVADRINANAGMILDASGTDGLGDGQDVVSGGGAGGSIFLQVKEIFTTGDATGPLLHVHALGGKGSGYNPENGSIPAGTTLKYGGAGAGGLVTILVDQVTTTNHSQTTHESGVNYFSSTYEFYRPRASAASQQRSAGGYSLGGAGLVRLATYEGLTPKTIISNQVVQPNPPESPPPPAALVSQEEPRVTPMQESLVNSDISIQIGAALRLDSAAPINSLNCKDGTLVLGQIGVESPSWQILNKAELEGCVLRSQSPRQEIHFGQLIVKGSRISANELNVIVNSEAKFDRNDRDEKSEVKANFYLTAAALVASESTFVATGLSQVTRDSVMNGQAAPNGVDPSNEFYGGGGGAYQAGGGPVFPVTVDSVGGKEWASIAPSGEYLGFENSRTFMSIVPALPQNIDHPALLAGHGFGNQRVRSGRGGGKIYLRAQNFILGPGVKFMASGEPGSSYQTDDNFDCGGGGGGGMVHIAATDPAGNAFLPLAIDRIVPPEIHVGGGVGGKIDNKCESGAGSGGLVVVQAKLEKLDGLFQLLGVDDKKPLNGAVVIIDPDTRSKELDNRNRSWRLHPLMP
jgi:hypothetical protein